MMEGNQLRKLTLILTKAQWMLLLWTPQLRIRYTGLR